MTKSELIKAIEENTCPPWCWVDIVSAIDAYTETISVSAQNISGSLPSRQDANQEAKKRLRVEKMLFGRRKCLLRVQCGLK
jgi:hypothetical protein